MKLSTKNLEQVTREFGDVLRNREKLAEKLGINHENFVFMDQIHSDGIRVARSFEKGGAVEKTDGLLTQEPKVFLLGTFADCLPILFYDPRKTVVGLAHAGWRGTMLRIVQHMVLNLKKEFGCEPGDLICGLGPSITACCYEVGKDVSEKFERLFGKDFPSIQNREGKIYLDLPGANYRLLRESGVKKENIDFSLFCTFCDNDKFFSLRKEKENLEGEVGAVIGLKE